MSYIDTKASEIIETASDEELEAMTRVTSLSDAMRIGATNSTQLIGGWISPDTDQMCGNSASLLGIKAMLASVKNLAER